MPELPEVETIKTALSHSIGNCSINNLIVNNYRLRQPIPVDIKEKICGATILNYRRRAKYILMDLSNGLSLLWHMGMSGSILISKQLPNPPAKHDHVLLVTQNRIVTFNDPRRFGVFTYDKTEGIEQNPLLKNLGLEPFDDALTASYLYQKLQHKKIAIKPALMDQSIVVGIGNIYASEALFAAGISPLRPANRITLKETKRIIEEVQKVLYNAIEKGGSSLRDYKKPDGKLGYFQNMHCVYNKTGQKCLNCICDINRTGGIQKIVQAGRSSFYCPVKQK